MIKNKKIIALVPARGGSKGIRLKNLKKIKGKTLIEITSNFIDKAKIFDAKVLNSDHKKILKIGKKLNFLNFKRPKKLSGDKISDYLIIKYSLKQLSKLKMKFDYIVYLPPTSPKRNVKHFLDALNKVINKNLDGAWSVTKIDKKFHPLKVITNNKGHIKLFSTSGKKVIARQMLSDVFIRNGIFYIFAIKELVKQKTIYLKKILISETNYESANIDTQNDLNYAKKIL